MRLMPTTRRGTWALAGMLWLAAAAWLWWVAPYRLVARWPRSIGTDLVGFAADGTALLVMQQPREHDEANVTRQLNRLDLRTGAVDGLWSTAENLAHSRLSPDGRTVAIRLFIDDGERTGLFDVIERRWTEIARGGRAALPVFQFSPSGRYLAFAMEDGDGVRGLRIWDVSVGREAGTMVPGGKDWQLLFDYELDDGWLVLKVRNNDDRQTYHERIRVYAGPAWALRHTFELPPGHDSGPPTLHEDGKMSANTGPRGGWSRLQTWDLETGQLLSTGPESAAVTPVQTIDHGVPRWLNDAVFERLGLNLRNEVVMLFDPDSGNRIGALKPSAGYYDERWNFLGPDERVGLVAVGDSDGVHVWEYPPRRSWRWLAAAWAGSGFVVALLATWRVRRLRGHAAPTK
ncbi:MAG: hypothetical protein U0746_03455 [Gemmataceae bacterium]